MQQIRVLLVDDSPVYLGMMQASVKLNKSMCVVGCYSNGLKALEDLLQVQPHVIVCDLHMPFISGIDFIKKALKKTAAPIVAISRDENAAAEALMAGASCFVPKIQSTFSGQSRFATQLTEAILAATHTHVDEVSRETGPSHEHKLFNTKEPSTEQAPPSFGKTCNGIVAIGASTGGTDATLSIMESLPADFPAVLITQHMPVGFTSLYAERLQKKCAMQVCEATDRMRLKQGLAILATGGQHLSLAKDDHGWFVKSRVGEKISGHVPSVDALFFSVAKTAQANAIGVILTGMGADGAEGLLAMRQAGAYTFGQDQRTSVVYGMPKVAYDMGAVASQLSLYDIGAELIRKARAHLH